MSWSCETEGSICLFDSIAEAVDDYLCYAEYSVDDAVSVNRYRHVSPTPQDCGSPLEYILDRLDDEYLPDEATPDSPTQTMLDAEKVFIEAVLSEYNCRSLWHVETRTVNLREFFAKREVNEEYTFHFTGLDGLDREWRFKPSPDYPTPESFTAFLEENGAHSISWKADL